MLVELPRDYNAARWFIHRHVEEGRNAKTALIDDAGETSYGALAAGVNRCSNALRALGLRMEDRIVMCMLDGAAFPVAFWGSIQAGIVPIPINTLLTTADYAYMLKDSRARALIVSEPLFEKFAPILSDCPFLEHVIVAGGEVGGRPGFAALLAEQSDQAEIAPTTRDDVAFWLYSSGSTGAPKGAMHLQRDLMATAVLFGEGILGLTGEDVVFSAAKLFFAYGLGNAMTFPFHAGATAILMQERPTPEAVMRVMARHEPTIYYGVPTLYSAILAAPEPVRAQRSRRLRLCVSAGEALPEEVGKRWEAEFGVPIADGLGSTEMLHIFVSNRPGDIRYGTSGKPVPGYQVKIVDELDQPVVPGELGELVVCGPSAAMAYWNQRVKSVQTFRGPWTYTGDKYFEDGEGYLHYAGRGDDMLKVSGNWVSPTEVEATLIAHECVLEAAVIGAPDEAGLIKARAFVVCKPGRTVSAEDLQAFVKSRLAPYKYPRWIVFVEALPKTATGKIQRFRLRDAHG